MPVAVGFNPRFAITRQLVRRGATIEARDVWTPMNRGVDDVTTVQSSLRDEIVCSVHRPWVETHGYRRRSLRDENKASLLGDATPRQRVLDVVDGGFGQLALGEVQGLERFDLGEVLQAGVGDRGGVDVQRFQRGEVGQRLQPGVGEAAAMVEVQLAQVAERAEMLQAGVAYAYGSPLNDHSPTRDFPLKTNRELHIESGRVRVYPGISG